MKPLKKFTVAEWNKLPFQERHKLVTNGGIHLVDTSMDEYYGAVGSLVPGTHIFRADMQVEYIILDVPPDKNGRQSVCSVSNGQVYKIDSLDAVVRCCDGTGKAIFKLASL